MGINIESIFNPPPDVEFDYFDHEDFTKGILKWKSDIEKSLKAYKYDMTCLCVNEVLGTVIGMIQENIIYK